MSASAASPLTNPEHRARLVADARAQLAFFRASLSATEGFSTLDFSGAPLADPTQELHTATRLVHSYAMAKLAGAQGCDAVIDRGMDYLWRFHRDAAHGGYVWALVDGAVTDGRKLAYGHVFVLLAASSAHLVGHPDAMRLLDDVRAVLDTRFWEEDHGLFADEWNRDWTPFSTYRGMNANMHGVEGLLAAFEATGDRDFLARAGRILGFFMRRMAPAHRWRIPEHYTADWVVDAAYDGNPMFRPAGTTPGHSFEWARLLLQYWDATGRPDDGSPRIARALVETALEDAWNAERGGIAYTLNFDGSVLRADRYWWPVTEAIGALAALMKVENNPDDALWYQRLWDFSDAHLIDHAHGGWFPELDADNHPAVGQFKGKPDIYHALQADLFPLVPALSHIGKALAAARPLA
ncbi:MAG: AGE family epimerase/isomerase [Rhizobiaceae bacterium]|nr:AGE family epimerase/isomerase [Rhizobiaceae bacterium]